MGVQVPFIRSHRHGGEQCPGRVGAAIADVVADVELREGWLDRLWAAIEADEIPYLDRLPDYWGDLCGSKELAAVWADRLIGITRLALSPDQTVRGYYCGTSACLSALYRADRYQEIVELLDRDDIIWPYKRWAVKALGALGRTSEAIQYAESCRGPWTSDYDVDRVCEDILLLSGLVEGTYRYGLRANRAGTYLATFRAMARKYPHKTASEILHDLVRTMPGDEGKSFAAAKEAGLYDEALRVASASACDPRTLTRAARELAISQPEFAIGAGLLALYWLVHGQGYEITGADVWAAYTATIGAAQAGGWSTRSVSASDGLSRPKCPVDWSAGSWAVSSGYERASRNSRGRPEGFR